MSVDVSLQVVVKARGGGEEGQTDGHELPAPLKTVVTEVLGGLSTQLDVKLIPQTLTAPSSHHHLQSHGQRLSFPSPVAHVRLDEFEKIHGFAFHRPVRGDYHGFLDGLAAPGQHVSDGHFPPEQTLRDRRGRVVRHHSRSR